MAQSRPNTVSSLDLDVAGPPIADWRNGQKGHWAIRFLLQDRGLTAILKCRRRDLSVKPVYCTLVHTVSSLTCVGSPLLTSASWVWRRMTSEAWVCSLQSGRSAPGRTKTGSVCVHLYILVPPAGRRIPLSAWSCPGDSGRRCLNRGCRGQNSERPIVKTLIGFKNI